MGCYKDWVCKEVVDVDKLGEVSICHLTIKFKVFKSSLEGRVVSKGTDLSLEFGSLLLLVFEDCFRGVIKMRSDHEISRIFENLSKLIINMILDSCHCLDSDIIDGIMEFEWLNVDETFSFEKTRVFLDLRRSFHLLSSSILEHLSPHLGKSLASVFLELIEGISDVVLEFTYELLCWVS